MPSDSAQVLSFVGIGVVLVLGLLRFRRWIRARRRPKEVIRRCVCGYAMDQLDTIRCPECGRVSGFNATAEELNLSQEQLRQAKAKRDARERVQKEQ